MDDKDEERVRQAIINAVIKLTEVAGRSTLNPKIAEQIDRLIALLNEYLGLWGGAGLS